MKPTVRIKDASILTYSEHSVLRGVPLDHPRAELNHEVVNTSKILNRQGDTIETRNTIYKVQNWKVKTNA